MGYVAPLCPSVLGSSLESSLSATFSGTQQALSNDSNTCRNIALENQRSDVRQFEMNTTPFRYGRWTHMDGES